LHTTSPVSFRTPSEAASIYITDTTTPLVLLAPRSRFRQP
jgi:hypothetical protein